MDAASRAAAQEMAERLWRSQIDARLRAELAQHAAGLLGDRVQIGQEIEALAPARGDVVLHLDPVGEGAVEVAEL